MGRNPNAWRLNTEIEPAFDGGFIQNDFVKGTLFIRKTNAQKLAIKKSYRIYDNTSTTMCFVVNDKSLYYLNNDAQGDATTENDWTILSLGATSGVSPTGEFNAATGTVVSTGLPLKDIDALGKNGQYFIVTNAPNPASKTYAGLFRGNSVVLSNGDFVISVGGYYVLLQPATTWDSLNKPQAIVDYVNGIIVDHQHLVSDINDFYTVIDQLMIDVLRDVNIGERDIDFSLVSGNKLLDIFLAKENFYQKFETYLKSEVYNKGELDTLLAELVAGGSSTALQTENFTYASGPAEFTLAEPSSSIVNVFLKGVQLTEGVGFDYTFNAGVVTLADTLVAGDEVSVTSYSTISLLGSFYLKTEIDALFAPINSSYTKAESDSRYKDTFVEIVEADYTAAANEFIVVTTGDVDRTITLPASLPNINQPITIKKVDDGSGKVIIDGDASETIDKELTLALQTKNTSVTLYPTGVEWYTK